MALDATVSGDSANSYVTLAEADAIAAANALSAWAAKEDADRELALIRACQEIEGHRFHHPERAVQDQALKFPRAKDGDKIPYAVKLAQVLQAEWNAVSGEADRKLWEGAKAQPLKDSGVGSPLCPRAFNALSQYISRAGSYGA